MDSVDESRDDVRLGGLVQHVPIVQVVAAIAARKVRRLDVLTMYTPYGRRSGKNSMKVTSWSVGLWLPSSMTRLQSV